MDSLELLWENYHADPSIMNRNALMVHYVPLVEGAAKRSKKNKPAGVLAEDLQSYGIFGLIEAIEKFDPERGFKFETFAMKRINGSMLDELRKQDWLPRRIRTTAKKIEIARNNLLQRLGRNPTDQEIADKLCIEIQEVQKTLAAVYNGTPTTLDPPAESMSGTQFDNTGQLEYQHDLMDVDQYESIELNDTINTMVELINSLPEKEKVVFTLYYYENLPLLEIGNILNVTQSRACQILTKSTLRCADILDSLS